MGDPELPSMGLLKSSAILGFKLGSAMHQSKTLLSSTSAANHHLPAPSMSREKTLDVVGNTALSALDVVRFTLSMSARKPAQSASFFRPWTSSQPVLFRGPKPPPVDPTATRILNARRSG